MTRVLTSAILLLALTLGVQAQTATVEAELTKLLKEFLAGASRSDAAVHDRFWAEDLIYTGSSGRRRTKAEVMSDVRSAPAPKPGDPTTTYSAEDIRIRQYGNTAVVAFRLIGTTEKDGKTQVSQYLNTGTFLKRNGRWQVVSWQATVMPTKDDEVKKEDSTESYSVIAQTGVRVKMRDGVLLTTDIYRPKAEGKFPVLMTRTPYNRKDVMTGLFLASHGYVVIQQDTRGRFESGGEFYPFKYEMNDGYDSVEWAASLPYADGRVGMYGGSYVGATQMLAAASNPPHLVGIFPYVTAAEYHEGWTYEGGALMQWFVSSWSSGLALDTMQRKTSALNRSKEWVEKLPVEDYRMLSLPALADVTSYFRDWVEHETNDEFWRAIKISDHYGNMNIKALHSGGWHDIFSGGSIRNFIDMRKQAPTAEARNGQRLLMGPWAHAATSPEGKIGDVTFGNHAVLDMNATILKWYDYVMKGKQNEFATGGPVRIFVMGDNVWRDEQEFPLARTEYTKYYLHSSKGANSTSGDGLISTVAPKAEKPDSFDYDPANPVPTVGGRLCCGAGLPPGPFDQRPNEGRSDVLVFSTPPLEQDIEVTGFIAAELYASTSAADTDFTAMVVDVDPSGYARYLGDGIIRARFRNSTAKADPIESGKIYKYTIDLWATSNVFKAGHRIRVYISSSNFPRFNRNMNTGEKTLGATRMEKARQTIYHDVEHPSAIILPVIPKVPKGN